MISLPPLLLLSEGVNLPRVRSLRDCLCRAGINLRVPQDEADDQLIQGKINQQLNVCRAALIIGPRLRTTANAFFAFQEKVLRGQAAKLFLITDPTETVPDYLDGIAVVIPQGLTNIQIAQTIRAALIVCADLGTLRTRTLDSPGSPFVSLEAWPIALAAPKWPEDLQQRSLEEAQSLYWQGLYRTGYLEQWDVRAAGSSWLLERIGESDPLSRSLILSKGIAYAFLVQGDRAKTIASLSEAGKAAELDPTGRAISYVYEYRADLAVLEADLTSALRFYNDAGLTVRGVEAKELRLKADLAKVLLREGDAGRRVAQYYLLREEFYQVMNYRTGVLDILLGQDLWRLGETSQAIITLGSAETFFRDILPMPRNHRIAISCLEAVERGLPARSLKLPW